MALTAEQQKYRKGRLTASRVGALMSGDSQRIMNLYREMTEDPTYKPDDLSNIWPVMLGSATEQINLDRYAHKTGNPVSKRGDVIISTEFGWAACTLDGWDGARGIAVEAKHVGGWEPMEKVIARYQPQCHWTMIVTETEQIAISIIEGAREPVVTVLDYVPDYGSELFARANKFMASVANRTPPLGAEPLVTAPTLAGKNYEMTGNNAWASDAADWLGNREAARKAWEAEKHLKALCPADAARVHGHGVEIMRDRASRLHLRAA